MIKIRRVNLRPTDIPKVSDVVCICEPHGEGAVTVLANAHGRACLQRVFPQWTAPWEPNVSGFPNDWLHAVFFVSELASQGQHNLPPICGSTPLAEATPAALTFLLAIAAKHEGARAMTWNDQAKPQFELYMPGSGYS